MENTARPSTNYASKIAWSPQEKEPCEVPAFLVSRLYCSAATVEDEEEWEKCKDGHLSAAATEPISECVGQHGIGEAVSHIEPPFLVSASAQLTFDSMLLVEAINREASLKPP